MSMHSFENRYSNPSMGFEFLFCLRQNENRYIAINVLVFMANIYKISQATNQEEIFEQLASGQDLIIERIISTGQTTPSGQWYDQDIDEWVVLLQGEAELTYLDQSKVKLKAGDYLLIPAHEKHRVEYTSIEPPCIWLAVHGKFLSPCISPQS